jgi:hypothetical protein
MVYTVIIKQMHEMLRSIVSWFIGRIIKNIGCLTVTVW